MTLAIAVVVVVGLLSLLAGIALGWYLRRSNAWCPHCGEQLVCTGCGTRAAWPAPRATVRR
jgi:hypothetical protein